MSHPYVCPAEYSGSLDSFLRRMLHKPGRILSPYVKEGMTVFDIGCGPGYFTVELSRLVGPDGKVVAADLQQAMLDKMMEKVSSIGTAGNIEPHKCLNDSIGLNRKADFILLFWMVHEVPDKVKFLTEIKTMLNPGGRVFISEPKIHVRRKDFEEMTKILLSLGFTIHEQPSVAISRSLLAGLD
ncbi:MAG: class I SAM-dependent methyltransferase [Bacteroidales bacterium]